MVKRGPWSRPQASEGEAQHGAFWRIGRIGQSVVAKSGRRVCFVSLGRPAIAMPIAFLQGGPQLRDDPVSHFRLVTYRLPCEDLEQRSELDLNQYPSNFLGRGKRGESEWDFYSRNTQYRNLRATPKKRATMRPWARIKLVNSAEQIAAEHGEGLIGFIDTMMVRRFHVGGIFGPQSNAIPIRRAFRQTT